jgi:hypothetical protein
MNIKAFKESAAR